MYLIGFVSLLILFPLLGWSRLTEEGALKRLQAYLTLKSPDLAVDEGEIYLTQFPDSKRLRKSLIAARSALGDEGGAMHGYKTYRTLFPEESEPSDLLEEMAWGVIKKAMKSPFLPIREMACVGAYLGHDRVGIPLLKEAMRDSSDLIRAQAVKMGAFFRDQLLVKEVECLFEKEKKWMVRREVIRAIGKMEMRSQIPLLQKRLSNPSLPLEEAICIVESLVILRDEIEREEVAALVVHPRASFRLLGCQLIGHLQSTRDLDLLFALAEDRHDHVRLLALQMMQLLRTEENQESIRKMAEAHIQDLQPRVSIVASALSLLCGSSIGRERLERWICEGKQDEQELGAAALAATGKMGKDTIHRLFLSQKNPSVRLNLAYGLILQRILDCEVIAFMRARLRAAGERWNRRLVGNLAVLSCQTRGKIEGNQDGDDQILRLEMCNLLALLGEEEIGEEVRKYLISREWDLSFAASALLLIEGNETAIGLVRSHLEDDNTQIRLRTALIIALWGRDEAAIEILQNEYPRCTHGDKMQILEGIGRVGSTHSIPFLTEVLSEPSQTLRLIAAVAILQCLHH